MKKVLAIILSVAMLACFATSALADATASYTMTSDKQYVKAGEKFVVTVSMPEGRMSTGNVYVDYDIDALKVNPISGINLIGTGVKASGAANVLDDGVKQAMAFTYPSDSYEIEDTSLLAVTFTVPADAANDTKYEIKLRVEDVTVAKSATDPETEPVTVTVSDPITVTVGEAPVSSVPVSSEEPAPDSSVTPAPDSSVVTPSDDTTPSTTPSTVASTTTPSNDNPKTGDAGVAVFAGIVAAAAAAAFVVGKKKA